MPLGANRDDEESADPDAYWRRRFLILGGGLAVLGVLAWQFVGARPVPPPGTPNAARTSAAALRTVDTLPSAADGSAWPGPWPTPSPATPRPALTPNAVTSAPAVGGVPRPGTGAAAAATGARCAPAGVVLSLFTSQASYAPGARPRFHVYAVSTAASSCQMAFGPGSVRVVVTNHGRVVWDSASCKQAAAPTALFQLGVPQMLTISWNRSARPAGCAGSLQAGAWGTFQAVALSVGQSSKVRTFTLLR